MTYQLDDLEVTRDDPFKDDKLARQPLIEHLSHIIDGVDGPLVISLDSPWGAGKTTFVRMLMEHLKSKAFHCMYFNAWEVDYATDPLIAIVSSISETSENLQGASESGFKKSIKKVKEAANLLVKRIPSAAVKALAQGLINSEQAVQAFASALFDNEASDAIADFEAKRKHLKEFHEALSEIVSQLPKADKKPNLVFFIDELDRCRPSFSIELLERIKHILNVKNIIFVLSIDKTQLEASTKAIYGPEIKATEYLRRFIDLEYYLPVTTSDYYTISLINRLHLEDFFGEHPASHPHKDDLKVFVECFTLLAKSMNLSLRAQEHCIRRLRVVMEQTPSDRYLAPALVALLIALRAGNIELFNGLIHSEQSAKEVMDYLVSLPGSKNIRLNEQWSLMQAWVMAADSNRGRAEDRHEWLKAEAESLTGDIQAPQTLRECKNIPQRYPRVSITALGAKIELAARIYS